MKANHVSKKYCFGLKRSLSYGFRDMLMEFFRVRAGRKELRSGEFWALKDITFDLRLGECLGVIGHNGAGKSTLLKVLNGLIKVDGGSIALVGRSAALLDLGTGLNPVMTGRENAYATGMLMGIAKEEIDRAVVKIVEFAELGEFADMPVRNYSSGMRARLSFAIITQLDVDVLLVDEVMAVGDANFQLKCVRYMQEYLKRGAIIFVSHNMHLIQTMCDRCLVLERGEMSYLGLTASAVRHYYNNLQMSAKNGNDPSRKVELTDETPVVIDRLGISGSGGRVRTHDDMEIELRYRSLVDIDEVYWNFSIFSINQPVLIGGGRSRFSGVKYSVKKGDGEFRCTIKSLPLTAGVYALKAQLLDPSAKLPLASFGWRGDPAYFQVMAPDGEYYNRSLASDELVMFDRIVWEPQKSAKN
ncbi:MAG: Teichoic acids export ATP-binding protein TagH [bacterium ADurb.Bin400]|nr:MAG: Teichoic acids export ATP-binding protein TagH [bacterium ADurb.Bin400]